jgi:hypothetical protein
MTDQRRNKMKRLRAENKALKETLEIMTDKKVMDDIKKSLEEIKSGEFVRLSDL